MNAPAIDYQASNAFEAALFGGGNQALAPSGDAAPMPGRATDALAAWNAANIAPAMPSVDMAEFNERAAVTFQAAMPAVPRSAALENPRQASERTASASPQSIKIENLYVQAEECQALFDFVKMLMQSVYKPEEAAV
jgi:hypothetical protein